MALLKKPSKLYKDQEDQGAKNLKKAKFKAHQFNLIRVQLISDRLCLILKKFRKRKANIYKDNRVRVRTPTSSSRLQQINLSIQTLSIKVIQ